MVFQTLVLRGDYGKMIIIYLGQPRGEGKSHVCAWGGISPPPVLLWSWSSHSQGSLLHLCSLRRDSHHCPCLVLGQLLGVWYVLYP